MSCIMSAWVDAGLAAITASDAPSFAASHSIVCITDEAKPIIIDASKSYDPDFPEDELIFTWYCTSGKYVHLSFVAIVD